MDAQIKLPGRLLKGRSMTGKLNANQLKLIAIVAMTIDHFTDLFYPGFPAEPIPVVLHLIGRLTAPIMWYFVVEGYHHTRNVKRYMLRLGLFAVISHFAYCYGFGISFIPFQTGIFNQTSVMYPLFIAVVVMWLEDLEKEKLNQTVKFIITFVLIWSAFPADWSCIAVLAILQMNKYRGNIGKQMLAMMVCVLMYAMVSFFFVSKVYAVICLGVILVYPFLRMYSGERGKANWMKWFFYIYYPAHLIILGALRVHMYGNINLLF